MLALGLRWTQRTVGWAGCPIALGNDAPSRPDRAAAVVSVSRCDVWRAIRPTHVSSRHPDGHRGHGGPGTIFRCRESNRK